MNETVTLVDTGQSKILDLDVYGLGLFIAYTDHKEIITVDKKLITDIEVRFPIIRFINNSKFLLVDSRTLNSNPNAFILDFNGQVQQSFLLGDGIEDILIHNDKIVVTYFDEGVFGQDGPNNNGLTIFSLDGKQVFGFNECANGSLIYDCYCICKHGLSNILFYAYDIFNVINLNLDTFKWEEFKTPTDFKGASALTSINDNKIVFHSSYNDKNCFYSWDKQKNEVIKIGQYTSDLKGMEGGKFLAKGEKGFTIIDP